VTAPKRPDPAPSPRRPRQRVHGGGSSSQEVVPLAVVNALYSGLLKVIKKGQPDLALRIESWRQEFSREFVLRAARDGQAAATAWLVAELCAARLPDLRATKSQEEDARITGQYDELMRRLEPIFQQARSAAARNRQAAPLIAAVTGRAVDPDALPTAGSLPRFLKEYLGWSPVRLSRARRRAGRRGAVALTKAMELLALVSRDDAMHGQARAVLSRVRRETLSYIARYKP
jgi:hypothetical protein